MVVRILIEAFFFLLAFAALPVSVLYYLKSGERWIFPYIGIQLVATCYAGIEVLHLGGLSATDLAVGEHAFVVAMIILRAALVVFVPAFVDSLFGIAGRRMPVCAYALIAVGLPAALVTEWLVAGSPSYASPTHLSGAAIAVGLAVHVWFLASAQRKQLLEPMIVVNRLFLMCAPAYVLYLCAATIYPAVTGAPFRVLGLSVTNVAYGIWNAIFLWFILHFISTKPLDPEPPPVPRCPFLQAQLTDREREILEMVLQGMSNKEIAHQLGVKENTVKAHLFNSYQKLNIHTRVELVRLVYGHQEHR
jgi:DNA-binding CsgD family transcriptional regulator